MANLTEKCVHYSQLFVITQLLALTKNSFTTLLKSLKQIKHKSQWYKKCQIKFEWPFGCFRNEKLKQSFSLWNAAPLGAGWCITFLNKSVNLLKTAKQQQNK